MSLPRYPKYKDSGVEWIGEIPEQWVVAKTSRYFKIAMGQTILKEDLVVDGKWPVFSATEGDHYFGYIDEPKVRLDIGDLVIPARGNSIGNVKEVKEPSTTTQTTIYCKNLRNHKVLPRFCYYYMVGGKNNLFYFTQTAIPQITVLEVASNPILLPPSEEQCAIARFLDREAENIDALVEEQRRLIELLIEKRVAMISHAVTKGLNPDAPMKDSGIDWIGKVPCHWRVEPARHLFTERDERSESGEEEMLTVSHLTGVTPRSEKTVYMFEAETNEGYKKCSRGELVINTLWAWMGAMGIASQSGIVSPAYNVYVPREGVDPTYIDKVVRMRNFADEASRWSKGVWSSRLRLYPQEFFRIHFPFPPVDEQVLIAKALDSELVKIDVLVREALRVIDLLQERRTALISAAVTGKIDVRGLAAGAAA